MGASPKKLGDYIPVLKDQGIDYVPAVKAAGEGIQRKTFTVTGSTAYTFVFADEGLVNMQDDAYHVFLQNNTTAGAGLVSTKATGSFEVTALTDGDEVDVLVVGKMAGIAA